MLLRFLTVSIVLLWVASMGWLLSVIYAPPESRMVEIDPREVYEVFFNWNETTNMTLLESGTRRGQVSISGGSGIDPDTAEFTKSLSVSGMLESFLQGDGERSVDLFWRGVIDFTEEMELHQGDFSVRVPGRQLTAHLKMSGEPMQISARALSNQVEMFSYEGALEDGVMPLQLLPMASILGVNQLTAGDLALSTEARMGTFSFGGRDLRAYLLTFQRPEAEGALRVYLSEAGEPLRIESDFGMEAISEILVPLDAYQKPKQDS